MAERNPKHRNRTPNTAIPDSRLVNRIVIPSASTSARTQSSTALEDCIDIQHREIQSLLVDNQRLAATHVALKQELAAKQQEIRALSAAAAEGKAQRDAEVREVYERSLKLDAEVRNIDVMSTELAQVRADVKELGAIRQELETKLRDIDDELVRCRARSDTKHVPEIVAEIETLNLEIQKGRSAIEFEKKTCASNIGHRKKMDKNMDIMAREIERLQAELANMEKRARASAAGANLNTGYAEPYRNPDMGHC